jgi:hypothetical protein
MRRLPVVCAVTIALLLAGAAPPLALAAANPHPKSSEPRSALLSVAWNAFRDFVAFFGHEMAPNGLLSSDSGHGLDPNGQPSTSADSGHELDPNG